MEFDPVDHDATDPPFEQLRRQIAGRVSRGELAAGFLIDEVLHDRGALREERAVV